MPLYRLVNEYDVEADSKADAIAKLQQKNSSELLTRIKLFRLSEPKRGWKSAFLQQLVGK